MEENSKNSETGEASPKPAPYKPRPEIVAIGERMMKTMIRLNEDEEFRKEIEKRLS
jgi:hypothetical protein